MKRERKRCFSLTRQRITGSLMALAMSFALLLMPLNAYAYDSDTYNCDYEMMEWYVDNDVAHANDVKVIMYLLVQPNSQYDNGGGKWHYKFECMEGYFYYNEDWIDTDACMLYEFNAANKNVIDSLDEGDIWTWQFGVEEGTYAFAEPDGADYIMILPSSLGSPLRDDGYKTADLVPVTKGETIILYGVYGDWDWQKENWTAMQAWAKAHDAALNNGRTGVDTEVTSEETIEVEQDAVPEEVVDEPETFEEIEEAPVEAEDTFAESETAPEEEKENPWKTILVSGPIVLIILIACFMIKKKKDEDKESEDEESTK